MEHEVSTILQMVVKAEPAMIQATGMAQSNVFSIHCTQNDMVL